MANPFLVIAHHTHNAPLGMFGTLFILFFVHRRQRDDEREKRLQYWREQVIFLFPTWGCPDSPYPLLQNAFRQNILQMHETAQASIFLNADSGRRSAQFGITTEDSQAPMLQYGGAPASARQFMSEDESHEGGFDNDHLFLRSPYMHDNKFWTGRSFIMSSSLNGPT
jgi:hypothetical protein